MNILFFAWTNKQSTMQKTIFTSLPLEDLQAAITECLNSCLQSHKHSSTNPQQEPDRWFNLTELCNYLPDKPAKATVYEWVSNGEIPHYKGEKRLRFLKSEIDQWIKTGKRKTQAELAAEADTYKHSTKGGRRS